MAPARVSKAISERKYGVLEPGTIMAAKVHERRPESRPGVLRKHHFLSMEHRRISRHTNRAKCECDGRNTSYSRLERPKVVCLHCESRRVHRRLYVWISLDLHTNFQTLTIKEFLNLPKVTSYEERLRRKIQALRASIEVTGEVTKVREKRCCNKLTYGSYHEAMGAITTKKNRKPFRAYQCEAGNWHLTSTPVKHVKNYEKVQSKNAAR